MSTEYMTRSIARAQDLMARLSPIMKHDEIIKSLEEAAFYHALFIGKSVVPLFNMAATCGKEVSILDYMITFESFDDDREFQDLITCLVYASGMPGKYWINKIARDLLREGKDDYYY